MSWKNATRETCAVRIDSSSRSTCNSWFLKKKPPVNVFRCLLHSLPTEKCIVRVWREEEYHASITGCFGRHKHLSSSVVGLVEYAILNKTKLWKGCDPETIPFAEAKTRSNQLLHKLVHSSEFHWQLWRPVGRSCWHTQQKHPPPKWVAGRSEAIGAH